MKIWEFSEIRILLPSLEPRISGDFLNVAGSKKTIYSVVEWFAEGETLKQIMLLSDLTEISIRLLVRKINTEYH